MAGIIGNVWRPSWILPHSSFMAISCGFFLLKGKQFVT